MHTHLTIAAFRLFLISILAHIKTWYELQSISYAPHTNQAHKQTNTNVCPRN